LSIFLFVHPLFCQFIDFLVHPSIVLSIYRFSRSSIHCFVNLSIFSFIHISLLGHAIYLLVSPSTRLSVHLFVHSSIHSFLLHMFIIYPFIHLLLLQLVLSFIHHLFTQYVNPLIFSSSECHPHSFNSRGLSFVRSLARSLIRSFICSLVLLLTTFFYELHNYYFIELCPFFSPFWPWTQNPLFI
jgi:hypothetical protein